MTEARTAAAVIQDVTGRADPLAGRSALVTGASGGIGAALCSALSQERALVRRLSRQAFVEPSTLDSWIRADLTDDRAILALANHPELSELDILIHCAAELRLGPIATASIEDFDLQYQTNVRAPYLLTQTLLPQLVRAQGQIVFINSSAGINAPANCAQYAATKHALKAFADALRLEVNAHGVRVISIYPGRTATSMQQRVARYEAKPWTPEDLLQPDDIAAITVSALAAPRTAEVTDVHIRPSRKS
ncbi:MAG: SDR family NAD(P)-dependent oxidoreductase [Bryobacteraceae bacterium]|nr:SDR family NAD(P)-dependent oxidoreductase [Bryobacteraceae bacterium]